MIDVKLYRQCLPSIFVSLQEKHKREYSDWHSIYSADGEDILHLKGADLNQVDLETLLCLLLMHREKNIPVGDNLKFSIYEYYQNFLYPAKKNTLHLCNIHYERLKGSLKSLATSTLYFASDKSSFIDSFIRQISISEGSIEIQMSTDLAPLVEEMGIDFEKFVTMTQWQRWLYLLITGTDQKKITISEDEMFILSRHNGQRRNIRYRWQGNLPGLVEMKVIDPEWSLENEVFNCKKL